MFQRIQRENLLQIFDDWNICSELKPKIKETMLKEQEFPWETFYKMKNRYH
jgi:hypothetical protein